MIEQYQHYITKSIRGVYRRKLIAPAIYLLLLILLWAVLPLSDMLFPQETTHYEQLSQDYQENSGYVAISLSELYFTGYTSTLFGQTNGYYYYTLLDDHCIFVLLSPRTSQEGLPYIQQAQIRVRILQNDDSYDALTQALAEDLDWTTAGLQSKTAQFVLSEPAFHPVLSFLLFAIYLLTGLYALTMLVLYILYLFLPVLAPPCWQLSRFGKASELLAQAEEELATLPQLATEDMFITEHFFIEIASSGIAIIPIQEIVWIYKYSTLHKVFWYHFNISYTLHITANKHLYIQCPKNMKSDIDGVIDYLAEANHNILVGFSEENRLKVQELQDPKLSLGKLVSLLKRRF